MRRGLGLLAVAALLGGACASGAGEGARGSDRLRTEAVEVAAPRGRILDRDGTVLVEDGTLLQVRVDVAAVRALDDAARALLLDRLSAELTADRERRLGPPWPGLVAGAPLTGAALATRIADGEDEVALATGVGEEVRDRVEAEPDVFAGISVEPVPGRVHHYGALATHAIGHPGESGVELAADDDLRGAAGRIVYEVDDAGQRVRELTGERREPVPGRDVHLTIDIDLQHQVERALAAEVERRRGVVDSGCFLDGGCDPDGAASVAIDPRAGDVLALASYPTYDPTSFAAGISEADHDALTDDGGLPLLDRALSSPQPPAGTWTPFVAHAAFDAGLVGPDEVYEDTGTYLYSAACPVEQASNCSAANAGGVALGPVTVREALARGSDTYFYALADEAWRGRDRLGQDALQDRLATWGFGEPTGIDLAGEAAGRIPTPDWLRALARERDGDTEAALEAGTWTSGASGNMAVGQGDVLVTPLQMARAHATLANGGTAWRPRLVLRTTARASATDAVVPEPEVAGEVELPSSWRDTLLAGLGDVTETGTAAAAFAGFDQRACPVMGKTGTAQVSGRNDSSLFVGVLPTPAPGREAVISLATVVEGGGFGTAAAAPVARRVLEAVAGAGCEVAGLGGPDGPSAAPLGGSFDLAEAMRSFVPPPATSSR